MKLNNITGHLSATFVWVSVVVTAYLVLFAGLLQPRLAQAANFSIQLVPATCTDENGCGICEVVYIFTNVADIVGVFLSSLALLMFIAGGFMWIFSAGQTDRIERGKKIILGTVTGLAIVFLAWFAVNVIVRVASSSGSNSAEGLGTSTKIFSRDWWDLSYCQPATPTTCKGYSIGTVCAWGESGCAAKGAACTCFRQTDPTGDDNLCTGDNATSATSTSYKDKTCYCASQCTRLAQQTGTTYTCIAKSTYDSNPSRYYKANVSCTNSNYVCTSSTSP